MISRENSTGKPLADAIWLENHHKAKIPERTAFAKKLKELHPHKIVDLGCASGLWLELLNKIIPIDCEFIGVDSDEEVLSIAKEKSKLWKRNVAFERLDLEADVMKIPEGDLILAFNIFPYIQNLSSFIEALHIVNPQGTLAVRQYDGASIRFGPMPTSQRQDMEVDLRIATENSNKFHHYDLDRTFIALQNSSYTFKHYGFELFERSSPFPEDFIAYYQDTLKWTYEHISEKSASQLRKWIDEDPLLKNRYFYEVDLVALLS